MAKGIENIIRKLGSYLCRRKIVLTEMDKSTNKTHLRHNEHIVGEHWKASYYGLAPTEHPRGEMNTYQEIVSRIISTRQNDFPTKIIIYF